MKRFNEFVKRLSLTQQLFALIFFFVTFFAVFFFVYINGNGNTGTDVWHTGFHTAKLGDE